MRREMKLLPMVAAALLSLLSLAAGAQVSIKDKTNVVVLKHAPPLAADAAVTILASEPKDRAFEELCLLSATGGQTIKNAKTGAELLEKMKVEARKCGADAMIVRSMSDQTWKPLRGGIDQGARAEAVAIRYVVEAVPAARD
jgi:hypothetical protein